MVSHAKQAAHMPAMEPREDFKAQVVSSGVQVGVVHASPAPVAFWTGPWVGGLPILLDGWHQTPEKALPQSQWPTKSFPTVGCDSIT